MLVVILNNTQHRADSLSISTITRIAKILCSLQFMSSSRPCDQQAYFLNVMLRPAYGALSVSALIGLVTLIFDLLTSIQVHMLTPTVRLASILPILGFLCLSILEFGDRQTDRQTDGETSAIIL